MARKIKKKMSRKEFLREQDEFLELSEEVTEWGKENWPLLLIGTGIIAVLVVVVILIRSSVDDSRKRYDDQVADAMSTFQSSMQSEAMAMFKPEMAGADLGKSYEDAAYKFEKLLRDHPDTQDEPVMLFYLASSYLKAGNYDKAREYYGKVVSIEKTDGSLADMAKYNEAMSYYLEDKCAEAEPIFQDLIQSNTPTAQAGALIYGGYCEEELGKYDKAIEYYQLALDSHSDSKLTLGLDSRIEKIRKQQAEGRGGEKPLAPGNTPVPEPMTESMPE